jgi:hypothetical protein
MLVFVRGGSVTPPNSKVSPRHPTGPSMGSSNTSASAIEQPKETAHAARSSGVSPCAAEHRQNRKPVWDLVRTRPACLPSTTISSVASKRSPVPSS